jgi:hypothetical protein
MLEKADFFLYKMHSMQNALKATLFLLYAWLLPSCVTTSPTDYELNTNFEIIEDGSPQQWSPWFGDSSGYHLALDTQIKWQGQYALRIEASTDSPNVWAGVVGSRLPVWFKMRDLRLRGYLKRDAISPDGFAGLWCRASRRDGFPRSEEHIHLSTPPTEDWTWYELSMPLEEASVELSFGGILNGQGRVWLDSLSLDVDGQPYALAAARAATAIEATWLPTLRDIQQPLDPRFPLQSLHTALRGRALTVLWLPDDGLAAPWHLAQRLAHSAHFAWVAIDVNAAQLHHRPASAQQWQALMDTAIHQWQPSQPLYDLLRPTAQQGRLVGIDLGLPQPALRRLAQHHGQHPVWTQIDSLHRRLIHQIGRELIDRQEVTQLSQLQTQLAALPLPDSLQADWRCLTQLLGFYASNGASRYRDSCRLANLQRLIDAPDGGPVLMLMSGPPDTHQSHSLVHRLRDQFGEDLCLIGLTVGEGQARFPDQSIRPLAELGPHCYEYYLQQLRQSACWFDLRAAMAANPLWWQPRQMFIRSHLWQKEGLPFSTINWGETFDAVIYLDHSGPAQAMVPQAR